MPDASSSSSSTSSPAPADRTHLEPGVASVLALFDGPLAAARFPSVDRDAFAELEADVAAARAEMEAARDALVRAQAVLVERERALVGQEVALLARAHRALAYARVFAVDAPELERAVSAIHLPALPVRANDAAADLDRGKEPRRRGRPTKVKPGAPLFEAPSNDFTEASASTDESTPAASPTDSMA